MWKPAHVYNRTSILKSFLKDPRFHPFGDCNQHGRIGVIKPFNKSDVLLAQERILDHCSKAKRTEFKAVTEICDWSYRQTNEISHSREKHKITSTLK